MTFWPVHYGWLGPAVSRDYSVENEATEVLGQLREDLNNTDSADAEGLVFFMSFNRA